VIGAVPTIALVVFTAVVGVWLLRLQGLATLQRVQVALDRGELPTVAMLEGAVLLVCGALLLTPGFFTDLVGFAGLVPALRQRLVLAFLERGLFTVQSPDGPRNETRRSGSPRVIEGEYRRDDD